ncbi:hypothetical protein [Paenibacillus silvisoli]|uniref:hypothetical protein n=1 Tax=Paenibacillus silvisoli TaxID=3110539 RepID=UPI0028059163|nr:hypothetical protein [Paenibacillus silvisoli]
MNRRIFLFGLGTGIIIGAALLQLMIIGEKQVNMPDPLAQDSSEQVTYTQEELDKAVADERKQVEDELKQQPAKQQEQQQEPPQSEDKQTSEAAPVNEASKDDKADSKAEAEAKSTVVRIPPNSSVTETADILKAKGVITDKQAFIDLMRTTKLRAGYFAFKAGLSLEQVRKVITSRPNASAADLPASDK